MEPERVPGVPTAAPPKYIPEEEGLREENTSDTAFVAKARRGSGPTRRQQVRAPQGRYALFHIGVSEFAGFLSIQIRTVFHSS
jgi:hypothetical protein